MDVKTIIKTLMTRKVTYQFLIVLLGAFGIANAETLISGLEVILCGINSGCS